MSYGNILGEILGQLGQSRSRIDQTGRNLGSSGGGLEGIFGQVQDALAKSGIDLGSLTGQGGGGVSPHGQAGGLPHAQTGTTAGARPAGGGGFAERARDFLGEKQVGTLSGAQIGGIGAAAGAILGGGGIGGAARGGIMAILGTLAVSALRSAKAQAGTEPQAPAGGGAGTGTRFGTTHATDAEVIDRSDIEHLVSPAAEKLAVRAMINAAKADGQIDKDEITRILGKLGSDSVSEDERQFVLAEMKAPVDIQGLAAQARTPAAASQVYAASLLAIHLDTEEERRYLADLAQALNLDAATVAELHRMTGAAA